MMTPSCSFLLLEKCDPSIRFYHGHVIYNYWNTYIEGENITFVCDTGYSPENQQSTITCAKNGWSPAPRCILPGELLECQLKLPDLKLLIMGCVCTHMLYMCTHIYMYTHTCVYICMYIYVWIYK